MAAQPRSETADIANQSPPYVDVDLYASTLAAFEFFYPRMLRGGVIITHDYSVLSGVAEATRSFLADKPEQVIELPTTQAMVVKL